ncbi:hypothetical protein BDZ91DRAFT_403719 [Kalaharituber pfeilii]|nr:hypothetical protein BDZ91DRAFT_403719 [Kalaharituber pfeilii]
MSNPDTHSPGPNDGQWPAIDFLPCVSMHTYISILKSKMSQDPGRLAWPEVALAESGKRLQACHHHPTSPRSPALRQTESLTQRRDARAASHSKSPLNSHPQSPGKKNTKR